LILGLTVVPQEVGQAKLDGRFEYLSTFPVPRLTSLAADVTFWLLAQVPGTALALLAADLRFGLHLQAGWVALPVFLLVALSSATVGYTIAALLRPQVAQLVTQFISLGVLLFSPINFPLDRLPAALRGVHRVLPVVYMADLVRWSLGAPHRTSVTLAFALVSAWCAAGLAVSYRVAVRQR
jgi:ABC-2 type transport system permease protein